MFLAIFFLIGLVAFLVVDRRYMREAKEAADADRRKALRPLLHYSFASGIRVLLMVLLPAFVGHFIDLAIGAPLYELLGLNSQP